MFKTLKMALKIDLTYAINANMYFFKRLPILRDLLNDDVYKGEGLKKFARVFSILVSALRFIVFRLLYFLVIYFISSVISPEKISETFLHIYFIFTIIGMFINFHILSADTKKYFCIILFNMDAKEFMRANFLWDLGLSLVLNSLGFLVFGLALNYSLLEAFVLVIFSMFARVIGEAISVSFYKKKGYLLTADYKNTFVILGILLAVAALPFFKVIIPATFIYGACGVFFLISIFCYEYLMGIDDYKLMFKKINTEKVVMNSSEAESYARQDMVKIREKDKNISSDKLANKKGYDLFNTIFFERHREILMRSSKRISVIAFIATLVCIFLVINNRDSYTDIHNFILNRLGWFVLIMYFINRGSVVTQAMFYNCDHAMLTYNFYRESDVMVNLFKKRLVTIIKINLLPAVTIAFGVLLLLIFTGGTSIVNYITIPLFIIILSVFFSVHYLVIYYLLQPYNNKLEIKSFSYTFITAATYFVCYSLNSIKMPSLYFSIFGLGFTILYILISLKLVYKKAPGTFKLRN